MDNTFLSEAAEGKIAELFSSVELNFSQIVGSFSAEDICTANYWEGSILH
jgi:hypothetical protein